MTLTKDEVNSRQREYLTAHREHNCKWQRDYKHRRRAEVLNKLGGKCTNPYSFHKEDITDVRVLQIDHKRGWGTREMRTRFRYHNDIFLVYLLKLPEKELRASYQLLCANCNVLKRHKNHENVKWEAVI